MHRIAINSGTKSLFNSGESPLLASQASIHQSALQQGSAATLLVHAPPSSPGSAEALQAAAPLLLGDGLGNRERMLALNREYKHPQKPNYSLCLTAAIT